MDLSQERIDALVAAPSESLVVELKRWIDPKSPEGIAKIAKAAIALRNRNGGYFVVGFDDKTLQPDITNVPSDVRTAFSVDVVQAIISRYAYPLFEAQIGFAVRNGQEFPVIGIPEGIRAPHACRRDLLDGSGKKLLHENTVYVRTLGANGTPSTAAAKATDWAELVEFCFENREADISRFLRRLVGGGGSARLMEFLGGAEAPPTLEEQTKSLFERSTKTRVEVFAEQGLTAEAEAIGSYSITLLIDPPRDAKNSSEKFLNIIGSANPNYTGWPIWLDSRGFMEPKERPRKRGKAWETLMYSPGRGFGSHFDYYLMDEKSEFYLWRVLDDDRADKVAIKTVLDPMLMLGRVTEAIAVGLSFAHALGYGEEATLGFYFRWEGLKNRQLDPWANRESYFSFRRTIYDDTAEGFVAVPAGTAHSSVAPYVKAATADLFASFDGFDFPLQSIEKRVAKVISRSW